MKTRSVAVVAVSAFSLAAAALAAPDVTVGGIRGGSVFQLVQDPASATRIYAGVYGNGVYRSTNGGISWGASLLPTIGVHSPSDLLASKSVPGVVLSCEEMDGNDAVSFSSDGGATFSRVFGSSAGGQRTCTALAEGRASGTFYAGMIDPASNPPTGALYKSTDGGRTWNPTPVSIPNGGILEVMQLASGRLVMLTGTWSIYGQLVAGGPVLYSDNDGATTTNATGLAGVIGAMAFNGTNELVAASASAGNLAFFRSTDAASWIDYASLANAAPFGFGFHLSHALQYHAGSDTFFMLGPNGQQGAPLFQSGSVSASYAWTGNNLLANVSTPVSYLPSGSAQGFLVDAAKPSRIFVGAGEGQAGNDGLVLTTNAGASWSIANAGIFSQYLQFATKERASGFRYAHAPKGFVYFSGSSLQSWKTLYRPVAQDWVGALAYDASAPQRIYVTFVDQFVSSNHRIRMVSDATTAAEDVAPFSHSGWTAVPTPTPDLPVLSLLVDGASMYAGVAVHSSSAAAAVATGNYLFHSANGGASWTATSLSVRGGVRALAFDPGNHQRIYAGVGDYFQNPGQLDLTQSPHPGGLYVSNDGGASWTPLGASTGLATEAPKTIAIDPANPQRLWVHAVASAGGPGPNPSSDIWESVDGGATWKSLTPSVGTIRALAYSSSSGVLFYASDNIQNGANIYGQVPGTASKLWHPMLGVSGDVNNLYSGSLGIATGTGLFEADNVGLQPNPTPTPGNSGKGGGHGCGCSIDQDPQELAGLLAPVAILALLLTARRRAR